MRRENSLIISSRLRIFYMMEYYASDNDCVNAISCGHEGIKYQLATQEYELVARTYNVLGVCNFVMGNFTKAVDYYLSSIDYSKEYRFAQIHGMAASNLAIFSATTMSTREPCSIMQRLRSTS